MSGDSIKDGIIMLHPVRWKILDLLHSKGVGAEMYIEEIANSIEEDRRLVSFHLGVLQERGFLVSDFKIVQKPTSKGKAGRFFKLTPKYEKSVSQHPRRHIQPNPRT